MRRVRERIKRFFTAAYRVAADAWRKFSEKDGSQAAAAFAFYAYLSMIALTIMGGAILGTVLKGNPNLLDTIMNYITENVPAMAGIIDDALTSSIDLRGVLGVTGILVLLYSGTKVFDSFQIWLNRMWGEDTPKYVKKKAKSLLTILFFAAVLGSGFVVHYTLKDLRYISFLALLAVYLVGMAFIYSFSIGIHLGWGKVWAGSLFVAVLIYPLQALLTWYYTSVSSFETLYGSLAGLILPLIGIYYVGYIIYLGAALNRALDLSENETPASSQEGSEER